MRLLRGSEIHREEMGTRLAGTPSNKMDCQVPKLGPVWCSTAMASVSAVRFPSPNGQESGCCRVPCPRREREAQSSLSEMPHVPHS